MEPFLLGLLNYLHSHDSQHSNVSQAVSEMLVADVSPTLI